MALDDILGAKYNQCHTNDPSKGTFYMLWLEIDYSTYRQRHTKRAYVNHPVLLKVWKTRFFPSSSSSQSAKWFTSSSMSFSAFPPTW